MFFREVIQRIKFSYSTDRIGPDILFTHWKLHFKSSMKKLCNEKFFYFGENADFRPGAYAEKCSKISLGKNVVIRPNTMLFADEYETITLEDDVMVGAGVHFYVDNHRFDRRDISIIEQGYYSSKPILVKKGAWIGANSIILPGVTLGINTVIGAGSVVTKSIPDYCVAVGNPAKVIKEI